MGLQPRQQLYIVGGIAALFAVLTILFIILFATKKCDKCADSTEYNSIVAQLQKGQDSNAFRTSFESHYTIFKFVSLALGDQNYPMLLITYTPADNAATVMKNVNITYNWQAVDSTSPNDLGLCQVTTTTPGPTTTPYTGTTTPYTGPTTTTTTTTTTPAPTTTPYTGTTTTTTTTTTTPFTGTATTPAPVTLLTATNTCPPTQPQQITCPTVPTNPPPSTFCSSVVKDFVFIIDIMPDLQGNTAKANEINSALKDLAGRVTFGDAGTRFGLVGFFDATATGLDIYNNYNDFTNAVSNLVGRISSTNNGSFGNLGAAFASVQNYKAYRAVDIVLIIISDHPPISFDGNVPVTSGVTKTAANLTQAGYYIGAITPVADTFSTITTHYDTIVSNIFLRGPVLTSYTDFSSNVQSYLWRTVCGYVSNPSVPTTAAAPTAPVPTFSIYTSPVVPLTTSSPTNSLTCLPVNLIFVLDNSQSINNETFNIDVRAFVKYISLGYAMKGEIDGTSSKIGIVQFASNATVTYPMIERTRTEFKNTVDQAIYYISQGITNISLGLDTALGELQKEGISPRDNVMVILVTDGVSTLDIIQTEPAAKRVQAYTEFFAGVGIDGVNGNTISANLTNLRILINNTALAYADIAHAEDPISGIWPETRAYYPCPVAACKGVIFIGEMTEVIAQQRKEIFLNATQQIANFLNTNPGSTNADQLEFAIGTYGNGTLRPIILQSFADFSNDLQGLITDIIDNNLPNAGQTNTSYILDDLYNVITTGSLKNYLVLFMGETERILDIQLTEASVARVVSTSAEVFVLDMTNGFWTNDYLFKDLVKNDLNKLYNYTTQSVAELTSFYTSTTGLFDQTWSAMTCTAPPLDVCNAFFDMFLVVKQSTNSAMTSLKTIASYLNSQYTAISGNVGFTKRGLVYYGSAGTLVNDLDFNTGIILNSIQNLPLDPNAANNYANGYGTASGQMQSHAATRYYAQNIIVIISDVYPASTDQQCTDLSTAIALWNSIQNTPVVYYVTTSSAQPNQQPCAAIRQIFYVAITNNPISDHPKMDPIIDAICKTPLPPLLCPCSSTVDASNSRKNFLQRYFG